MRTPICLVAFSLFASACDTDLGERTGQNGGSFGAIVFREACQRVTYSAELAGHGAIDPSGTNSLALCTGQAAPSESADGSVRALFAQRDNIVTGVDKGVPAQPEDLQSALDGYLRAVQPLQDDGTLPDLITRTATVLATMAADDAVSKGLGRLGHIGGMRPAATSGGLLHAVAVAPGLDAFVGASLPLLDVGGIAANENRSLLAAGAFELRHLERASEAATSTERTPYLLRQLLTTTHPDLVAKRDLFVALRDPRGLPLLQDIAAPYVLDMASGLPLVDGSGYFLATGGARIPYVSPLPQPGETASGMRDASRRALRSDGKLLYQYANLDGSLLGAALDDAQRLFDDSPAVSGGPSRDMLFGMLQGAAQLVGKRTQSSKTRDGETISFSGFDPSDSTVLDLVYAGAQLLRFQPTTAGQDLGDALRGVRTLLANSANENAFARVTQALLAAADEAKLATYDSAKIPADSTLYDDLVPIITRLLAVDDGVLAEDLVAALGDEHVKNLGPITAQLADERGYFFMRQYNATDGLSNLPTACAPQMNEEVNGLTPCGVVGEFGNKPDRGAADSDQTLDWRGKKTSDAKNNRSVLQRLLHMVADSGRSRPFCNGRLASVFGGLVSFDNECDMFQVDSVGRFFMLSMASPALRDRSDTYAKQSASFREAIRNGKLCRGATPDPTNKCNGLLSTIDDGTNGDLVLEGMMGIKGFGRYPEPATAARAIFADVASAMSGAPKRTRSLLFNHVMPLPSGDSEYTVDASDADNRKFRDGAGVDRLFIDEHNGVLFALEKVHGPTTFSDGTTNKYPSDTFYDALRPIVDAFAKHAECATRDPSGTCTSYRNATQILVDAMAVLHRHYPTGRSQLFGRDLAASYGSELRPDGAMSYELLLAKVMGGDLLLANGALSPILTNLTVDGMTGSRRVLPLLVKLGRFVFDAGFAPTLTYRDHHTMATRNDGQPAGPATVFYMIADALAKKRQIFELPANQAAKASWDRARSDVIDVLMKVNTTTDAMTGTKRYSFADQRLRPMGTILLDFLVARVVAHKSDLAGWSEKLVSDATDTVSGPLLPAAIDAGVKLSSDDAARAATYALLRQLFDPQNRVMRDALAVAAIDAVQLLLDEDDLLPIGRSIGGALDPDKGPLLTGITLMRRGRELEQASSLVPAPKQVLFRLLSYLFTQDENGLHPMWLLSDAIGEVNRANPGAAIGSDFTADDYHSLLATTAAFLVEKQRGLMRFLDIVAARCLPGSQNGGCPASK